MTERIHDSDTFCRMVIRSADSGVLIDLAVNAPPRAFYADWRSELAA
jgi:hypothetical protein